MSETKSEAADVASSNESESVLEHFWPEHLSGGEVKQVWPRGRDVTICGVSIEDVYDKNTQATKPMVVVYFDGVKRGLVTNKTNGRWLAAKFGSNSDNWVGKVVSIVSANRSNGTVGVDVGDPFGAEAKQ